METMKISEVVNELIKQETEKLNRISERRNGSDLNHTGFIFDLETIKEWISLSECPGYQKYVDCIDKEISILKQISDKRDGNELNHQGFLNVLNRIKNYK
ncbi:hypothetical protein HZA33_03470 [Candidatus Pacearchaeota archaeon]|nr:hypothetical protein [Candidatus Pacearchaeota archaeon]